MNHVGAAMVKALEVEHGGAGGGVGLGGTSALKARAKMKNTKKC